MALASLEILVHCEADLFPRDLVAVEINVPKSVAVEELDTDALPRFWRRYPAPASLRRLGNAWIDGNSACILRVPSALVPSENNYLINPAHPHCRKLRVVRKAPFQFDPRLVER